MNAEEKYTFFDAFLDGTLSDPQREAFEKRLKESSALRDEFALYREAREAITARMQWESSAAPFLETLNAFSSTHFKAKPRARIRTLAHRRWSIRAAGAAAAVLLIVIVWQPWQRDLYTRFAHHPRAELTDRSGDARDLIDGERAYNQQDYAAAAAAFGRYLEASPADSDVLFYRGISLLELGQTDAALQHFRRLFDTDTHYRDAGAWYLGLTYLRREQRDSTAWYLSRLRGSSEYSTEARRLLRKL